MKKEIFKSQYSTYYNLFYSEKNYNSEVEYVISLLNSYAPTAKTILEYGCGTGGHGTLLQEKGYEVLGVERSADMAAIAKSRGLNCVVDEILTFQTDRKFDVCLALFHVVSYLNANDELLTLFSITRTQLEKGGVFIFDTWFSPAVNSQKAEIRIKNVEHDDLKITRIAIPKTRINDNVVEVQYQISIYDKASKELEEIKEVHAMRHFSIPEIQFIASRTGFELVKAEEFITGKPPSFDTWGLNFILKAI